MALSDQQRNRIQRLVEDEWEREEEFEEFFTSVTDPEELHLFADGFNWDTGVSELRRVIEHPMCDHGTALFIYWRGEPGYYLQYSGTKELPEYEFEAYVTLKEIEQRVLSGKYATWRFSYDPHNDHGHDLTPKRRHIERYGRDLPAVMYDGQPKSSV